MWNAESAWEGVCLRRGLFWGLVLLPLSKIYGFVSRFLRLGGGSKVEGLRVVSVGNLGMGGSGKSPLVIEVAGMLKNRRPAVLTRGYGGDEAEMLGLALPFAKILVNPRRLQGAEQALELGCGAAVLDDGFQRRHELARDLDILVLDWQRRELEAHCLPAGRLREPLFCALEADAVVVTHAPEDWNPEALRAGLPWSYQALRIFRGDHEPLRLLKLEGGAAKPLSWLKGKSVTALSGIGRPEAFEQSLRRLGAQVQALRFKDHHAFKPKDLPASGLVVCTAKDAVKLRRLKPGCEIWVLEMRLKLSDAKAFKAMVLG